MPGQGSVPFSSIFSCLGRLPPPLSNYDARSGFCAILLHLGRLPSPLSSYDARSGFCTILLHLLLSWPSPSSLVQLWWQVRVLYHPPPSSPVLAVSLLPGPAMMTVQGSVPSSSIFSCLGRLPPPLSSYDARSGFCTILLHLLLSWPSPSSLVQLWCQVWVLYHPPPSSPVLAVFLLPCPAMMPGQGSVPSSSIFSCLGRLPSPLSNYDTRSGFCIILLHLLLSWPSPSSFVQLWCQVRVLCHPPPSSPVLAVSLLPCPAMMPGQGSVPSSSIFSCLGRLPSPLSSYDARSGFCTILLHLLLSWPSPSSLVQLWWQVRVLYHPPPSSPVLAFSLVQLWCQVRVLYHPPPSSPVLAVSFVQLWCQVRVLCHPPPSSPVLAVSLLPCPTMMPGQGSVPSSSIFSCLGRLPSPLSSYDARSGFCTILLHLLLFWPSPLSSYDARSGFCAILLHLLLSWPSPSSLVQLWCQVRVLCHPPPSSPVLAVSLLPCPAMMPGQGSVPSSSIFSCLGRLPSPLSSYDARSGFCTILLHLLLSWPSPSSLVQLWWQVGVLYHPPPSSPVLAVSLLPCPAMMTGQGSVPSSSIFSCPGPLPSPLSSYDARSGFCTILLHLLLSWPSPSSLVQLWCQVWVLYHPPPSSPVLAISLLPCPAMIPGLGSVPSSSIFCLGRLPPPLSNYDARLGFCTILLHLLLSWPSPSSLVQLWCQVGVLYHPPPSSPVLVVSFLPCPAMMPGLGSVPSSSIFSCLGHLPPPLSSYDARSGFCTILLHLLSWSSPSSFVQLWYQVWVLYHPPPSPVLAVSLLPCPTMMPGWGSVPSSSIFSCHGRLLPPLSSYDARSGFCTILHHLLLSWSSPSSLVQLWCQVGVLYHPPPSSPVLAVSLLPCPAMMPGLGSVPSSSIFSCLGHLPPPLSSYDARSGFCTILLHLLSWSSPSSLVQLWYQVWVLYHPPPSPVLAVSLLPCPTMMQVGVLYHPPPSSPVLAVSLLPCPTMMPGRGSVPSSTIFSCHGRLPSPLSSYDARSGFCTILLHLLLSWPSPSSLVQLWWQVRVLYHPPPSSPVLAVSLLPGPAMMTVQGSVPSSSIFSCLGRLPPPLSSYDARSGFCTILLHLLLSWPSPSSLVQLWCQVWVLYHPPPSSPVLAVFLLPCPAMMPGQGSVPSSSIFSCLGRLPPPLSSYDARSGFCIILLHLLLSWPSPSSLVQLWCQVRVLYHSPPSSPVLVVSLVQLWWQVWVLYHPPPSSPVLVVSLLPCPAMMPGQGSVPSSSIFSCLGLLPCPAMMLGQGSVPSSSIFSCLGRLPSPVVQLWCQVRVLYHPPPSSPVLVVSLLPCPAMMPGQGSVPSSSIFSCLGRLPSPLSSYDDRSGFCAILLHLLLSWPSPFSLVQLWCQVRVLYHPPPSSPVLAVSLLPCPAMMPGLGSVPSSSIFSCLGHLPPPLSSYDTRSGFCTILLHLLSWSSPSSLVQLWCQVGVLYHPPPSSPVLAISLLPCPAMMPGRGSVPSSTIFSCLGRLLPPLSSYDARSGFCTILLHLLLSWPSPSSLVQLWCQVGVLYHPPPSSVLVVSLLLCPAMIPGLGSVPSSSISCLGRLPPPLSNYDARLGFCTILLHLLLSWPSPSSLVQLWCQVGVLYHPPPSSPVLVVSFLPCPAMMPGRGSVPSSSIFSCLGRLPPPLSSYDARSGFCTILLHLLLSWPSPSSLVQLWCQVGVLYHPPPSSVLVVSLLPCPAMIPGLGSVPSSSISCLGRLPPPLSNYDAGWGSVPSSSIFSCLGRLPPPLSNYDARSGFCTILHHLLLSWPSPFSLVQLWCQVRVLYHSPPSSPVLAVSLLPCPAMMTGQGSVPSSSIFSCLGRLPPPWSSYDDSSGFCTILLHLLLSWPSPSSLVQLWCQVRVLYHSPPSSPVLAVSLLPCPAMMPGLGSVPSSSIFSCLGRLPPPLSSYDARSGFCTILLHLLLSWPSPSSFVQLWCQVRVLYHPPSSSPVLAVSLLPCPAMMPGQGSVPSSSIFSCLGLLPCPAMMLGQGSVPSSSIFSCLGRLPSPVVQLWCQVRVLYHPPPSSPVLVVSLLPCPAMMPGQGSVPSSSIFSCLGRLPSPLSSYDDRSGFCAILLHLLLSWPSPFSLVQLWCQVRVLYHPPPSSPVLAVSLLPCPAMMPGLGSVPSSSIFSCLGHLPPPLSSYDTRSGFCTILLHLLSWSSPSSLVQLWCQVGVLYHPPPSSPVLAISLLPCPAMMPGRGSVPSSTIFSCLGRLLPPLSSYDARSGFCTILLHLLLSWPSPSSLVQLWCQVGVLYHPPPSSVLVVSLLLCPAMIPGLGSVPSSSISCLGRLPPPLSNYDARLGFCTILLHLLLSWPSPSSLVQLWCQVGVLYHPPPSSPVLVVSFLPCPAMMPGRGSVPSSSIFSCLGRLPPPLSSYDARSGFCTILLHLLLSWPSPSSLVQLWCQVGVLYHPPPSSVLVVSLLPCPAMIPGLGSVPSSSISCLGRLPPPLSNYDAGWGSVPSSSIFSCLGRLPPPLSNYDARSGFCTILHHLLLSWPSPFSLVQLWCQVRVLYHSPPSSPVLAVSLLPCPAMMTGQGSVPSSSIFSCLGRLPPPWSSYDDSSGFCTILLHLLLSWPSPSSLVQLWCQVRVLYHSPPSSPVLAVSLLPCPAMMPGLGSVPSSSIFSCLGRLPPPLSSYDARSGFCTILLHLLLSWPSPSSFVQLWCQVRVLYHPPSSSPVLAVSLLPCPAMMPGQGSVPFSSIFSCLGRLPCPAMMAGLGSVPSSSIFSCLGRLPSPLSSYDARSGFCTILLHLLLSWPSPLSSYDARSGFCAILLHLLLSWPSPFSRCPAMMPGQGSVPSSSIFSCLGRLPSPLSSYDARSGFCTILLHLLLSWPSPFSLVQLWCQVRVLYHPPPSSPVLAVSLLPCPAMMPGLGSVPSSSIFSCLGHLPPPLSSYDTRSGFCTILLHLLSWSSPSSLVQLWCQVGVLYHPPPSSPVLAISLLPCPAMMPGRGSVPSSTIFSCLGRLLLPLSSYDARSGFCTILLHLLLSWPSPSSLVQLWCQVGVLYHPPPSSVLVVSLLLCPAMIPGLGSVPSSSISCLGRLPPPLSNYDARLGFCTILLHLLLSWPSPSSLVQLWCQVGVLYHPPPSSPVLVVSFLPCPAMMPGRGSVPSSSIFSCLGRLPPPLSSYDARSGFCTILLHLLLSWPSPSSLVQLWCQVGVLYHPPPSSVLVVSLLLLPCPAMMPGQGSVPSSSIFSCLGRLPPPLSSYDTRSGFCTILLHLLSWPSPSSLVQLWCQVGVLYHPPPSSPVLAVSLLPCPTMMPGRGSVPSSTIFSCHGRLPPPLSSYDARSGFCTILLHLLLSWPSPSSLVQLWCQVGVLYHPPPSSPVLAVSFLPCPAMMPGLGSVPSSAIFSSLGHLPPPNRTWFMPCLILSIHFILGLPFARVPPHFHLHRLSSYFLHPSSIWSIPAQPALARFQCDVFDS